MENLDNVFRPKTTISTLQGSTDFNTQFEGDRLLSPEYTGRTLLYFKDGIKESAAMNFFKKQDIKLASASDFSTAEKTPGEIPENSQGIYFKNLGIALLDNWQEGDVHIASLKQAGKQINHDIIFEAERVIYAVDQLDLQYLKGYYDAIKFIYEKSAGQEMTTEISSADAAYTWGLQITNVLNSKFTGKGINIAILDTGFNLKHPEFTSRIIQSKSFIKGEDVDDWNGHGSHCIGTATGAITAGTTKQRFGIATDANIFAGKVLSNAGRGSDGSILDGIEWALEQKCRIISMSLGAPVSGTGYSEVYENVAKKALQMNTMIIAAAGNDSQRSRRYISPVSHPANCPSIMAVAAIDQGLQVADFSNGGQIDIAAPGVNIYSCWKSPQNFNTISGTSMATPHVAGIAALYAEAHPTASAHELWQMILSNAKRLPLAASDIGTGLVQAI